MSLSIEVDYSGEGRVDAVIARRLITAAGLTPGRDFVTTRRVQGKSGLDATLSGLNAGARFTPVLALRDLDDDAPCAGGLVADLFRRHVGKVQHPHCLVRVSVRSIETWLMADTKAFATASGIPIARLPSQPETLASPKRFMVDLLRRHGSRGVLTQLGLRSRDEPLSNQVLAGWAAEFAAGPWSPERAAKSGAVPSLRRCLDRLRALERT